MTVIELVPPPDLVDLRAAHVTQLTHKGVKGDWSVRANVTEEELGTFNGRISDEDMFAILRFSRKYELIALNAGIEFQRHKQVEIQMERIQNLTAELEAATAHSDKLAATVERLTRGDK